ncbi:MULTISPECIES: DUF2273 domain-containing protein [Streptococcus]|uniref:Small integral membrane protein n=3 Tax=Streptococcus parauberis TaxID=1348 RepID=F1Z0K1_9STRE|nr:DUF2273 domain-containing protein [Streptococcus parauberis]AUT06180.1 hypothetical protein SPSF3K_01455 [Streptococcus parauberis]EGE54555.1 hypothetical protein SPB_0643 [Streptococcus parauberis NCFD 2020]EMF49942.1 Small integral membrane protein [Streptococcus parauberis KRS-02109]EMG25812.1 Small integral membrane protein [Streptococcus parauberis KRS-02083]KYP17039.1 hypothetical protein AKL14_02087 [Streptococcus parauberis]
MAFFEKYKYPIIGGVVGLVLAILLMSFGFLKTLIAIIFIVLGIYAGLFVKSTGLIDNFINRR